jgi:hypothetical protein
MASFYVLENQPHLPVTQVEHFPTAMAQVPRRDRVACLREFILDHFANDGGDGRNYLRSNGGGAILDVAGGKGDLSWILANADGR